MSNPPKINLNTDNTSPIKVIDILLSLIEATFEQLSKQFFPIEDEKYYQFLKTGYLDESAIFSDSRCFALNYIPSEMFKNGGLDLDFKLEIQQQRIDGNKMYFEFLNEVVAKHYQFIKKHLTPIVKSYFKREKDIMWKYQSYKSFYNSDIDFLKGIGYRYLSDFEILENIIYDNYPNYKRLLSESPILTEKVEEYFKTNYTKDKLLAVYQALSNGYIDCPSERFMRIFEESTAPIKKIQWLSYESNLIMLFSGHHVTNNERIYTSNNNVLPLIQKYFLNKEGQGFKIKQLGITYQKLNNTRTPRDSKKLVELIKQLNS